jgi:FKBP-type peptidyl-prolyl cis-trans isomerase (trigger factor)
MEGGKMQVSMTTTHGLERRLEIAVPGERVAGEVDERLKRLTRTARIKGFRPGKVPYAVVRQQFGSQVHAQTVNDLMQSTFAEAVSQQRLRPAGGRADRGRARQRAALRGDFRSAARGDAQAARCDRRGTAHRPGDR